MLVVTARQGVSSLPFSDSLALTVWKGAYYLPISPQLLWLPVFRHRENLGCIHNGGLLSLSCNEGYGKLCLCWLPCLLAAVRGMWAPE